MNPQSGCSHRQHQIPIFCQRYHVSALLILHISSTTHRVISRTTQNYSGKTTAFICSSMSSGALFFFFFPFFFLKLKKIPLTLLKILVIKQDQLLSTAEPLPASRSTRWGGPHPAAGSCCGASPGGTGPADLGDAHLRSGCSWLCKH